MNFQELEDIWNEGNRDLEQNIRVNPSSMKKINMKKITTNLAETRWENLIELGVNLWFLNFFKTFFLVCIWIPVSVSQLFISNQILSSVINY